MESLFWGVGVVCAPLLLGIINRVKALWAGRRGRPMLQTYFDMAKLLRKGTVVSETTSWVFRLGPVCAVVGPAVAMLFVPFAGRPGLWSFPLDFVVLTYVLALPRLGTMLAALDVGSSFEGMGASREAAFGALAEPALLAALLAAAGQGGLRLADGVAAVDVLHGGGVLLGIAVFLLLLVENARMPVDDPNTHLELTMIHEVMVLDHSGPELAAITYGAALKLWVFAALLVALVLPLHAVSLPWAVVAHVTGILVVAAAVGVVESLSARLPMPRVPAFILSGAACGLVVLFAVIWGGRL